ncbi:hypothetical protein NHX12_017908 [Muraenolepis orangiensis]|uniref:Uncharacterized protein n=1 Tax=Muraenolepis orangiensis TaxID=630683 RepID=A0A9Q0IX39_9TELE|nr:hypothetical protein NHX12_017908 [Muraenolepis orangiensis]
MSSRPENAWSWHIKSPETPLLKPYRCRDLLDNAWVVEHARRWTPTEVSPPTLDMDPADQILGLSQLFTDSDSAAEEDSSCPSLDPEVDTAALSVPSTPPDSVAPEDIQQDNGLTAWVGLRPRLAAIEVPGSTTGLEYALCALGLGSFGTAGVRFSATYLLTNLFAVADVLVGCSALERTDTTLKGGLEVVVVFVGMVVLDIALEAAAQEVEGPVASLPKPDLMQQGKR